ncbi:hypothetical protein [Paenibacillus sp. NPDC058071]|uniref:hypothetical protein n=1 Tax=Paenibacillus sp. NPDC058071 TaxID=3346326 RepID=UPI0036DE8D68
MKIKLNLMIMVIILLLLAGCSQNNSTYPSSVIVNDKVYGISVSEVSADKVGEKLGKVLKNRQPMPKENWESNNDKSRTDIGRALIRFGGRSKPLGDNRGKYSYRTFRMGAKFHSECPFYKFNIHFTEYDPLVNTTRQLSFFRIARISKIKIK